MTSKEIAAFRLIESLVTSPDGECWIQFLGMWQAIGVAHAILRLDNKDDDPLTVVCSAGTAIAGLVMRINRLEWMATQLALTIATSNPMLMAQITLGELAAKGRP